MAVGRRVVTRVDFYLLPDVDDRAKQRFCGRLACRAVGEGQRVHIRTAQADEFDETLWDYPPHRFLPHAKLAAASGREPVTIGNESETPPVVQDDAHGEQASGVLINVADGIPEYFTRFARVTEVVLATERTASREKYRRYRDQGYPLFHHELNDWE